MEKAHPFIDLAVLDGVRECLVAGDALCILAPLLDEVLWSNASGAMLLGFDSIGEAVGSDPDIGSAARRQIEAAGFGKTIAVRLSGRVSTQVALVKIEQVNLPGGEIALLLSGKTGHDKPSSWIEGLDGEGSHMAVIGAGGEILAGSPGFNALGIGQIELAKLAGEVRLEADRTVKRLMPSARGLLPAGIGLVCDEPVRGLLVVVEPEELIAAPTVETQADAFEVNEPVALPKAGRHYFAAEALASADHGLEPRYEPTLASSPEAEPQMAQFPATDFSADELEQSLATEEIEDEGSVLIAEPMSENHAPVLIPLEGGSEEMAQPGFMPDIAGLPVRFAWRINAKGEFCEVSPEFARIVGPNSADIIGRTFRDVARVYALDPGEEISDLLDRRDTWSGRSVLWPIEGTDMRAPVDLAALPVHARDKTFDGFKGFGVVRIADAVIDAEGIGLSLAGPDTPHFDKLMAEQNPEVEELADIGPDHDPSSKAEKPFLTLVPKPQSGFATDDKVIRLEVLRPANSEHVPESAPHSASLSDTERSAFREIAERLRESEGLVQSSFGKRETPPVADEPVSDGTPVLIAAEADEETAAAQISAEAGTVDLDLVEVPATQTETPSETASEDERLRYEAMLRDLIETADAQLAPQLPDDIETRNPTPLDYDAMLRDILDTVDKPAIDEKMIRVMPTEEILRVAEQHHQMSIEAASEIIETADDEVLPPAAVDDTDLLPPEEIEEPVSRQNDVHPLRPDLGLESAPLAPNIDIEADQIDSEAAPSTPDTSLLHRLPTPVLIYGGRQVHFANPAFLETTGYGSALELEILGGIDQLIAGDDPDENSNRIRIRVKGNGVEPFNAQLRSVPWDGSPAMMLTLGAQQEVVAQFNPVREPEQDQDPGSLRQQAAELKSILNTATDGVVVLDAQGRIRSLNQSAEALFGFDPVEVAGKPFSLLLATESQRSVNEYIAGMASGGVASIMNDGREVIGREAKGRFIPLFVTIGKLEGSDGYCAVLRDMTQWKRAEEELIAARRAAEEASNTKSEFLTRVSHEIRTPLNAIIGFSELMAEERFGPLGTQRYIDYAKDINRSGAHVLDLVNDLLDISKIEAGQQEMNFAAVALNEALSEAVALMQPQANRERVIIRSSFASALPDVVADLRSVKQIALNLLSNAVRYTGAGGQVIVSTAYELSGDVIVRVRDTGAGMSEADIEQAMKPFKQLNTVKRGRGDGTGLGLPLTKALVEGNRARFAITSGQGKGTLVEITFPSVRVLAN